MQNYLNEFNHECKDLTHDYDKQPENSITTNSKKRKKGCGHPYRIRLNVNNKSNNNPPILTNKNNNLNEVNIDLSYQGSHQANSNEKQRRHPFIRNKGKPVKFKPNKNTKQCQKLYNKSTAQNLFQYDKRYAQHENNYTNYDGIMKESKLTENKKNYAYESIINKLKKVKISLKKRKSSKENIANDNGKFYYL